MSWNGNIKSILCIFPPPLVHGNCGWGMGQQGTYSTESLNIKMDTQFTHCEHNNMHSHQGFMERWSGREGRQKRNTSTCILLTSKWQLKDFNLIRPTICTVHLQNYPKLGINGNKLATAVVCTAYSPILTTNQMHFQLSFIS